MRFIASTAGEPEQLIREAIRLAKPGGVVAMQEPDMRRSIAIRQTSPWDA